MIDEDLETRLKTIEDPRERADLISMYMKGCRCGVSYERVVEAIEHFGRSDFRQAFTLMGYIVSDSAARDLYKRLGAVLEGKHDWALAGDCARAAEEPEKARAFYLKESEKQAERGNFLFAAQFSYEAGCQTGALGLYAIDLENRKQDWVTMLTAIEKKTEEKDYGQVVDLMISAGDEARSIMTYIDQGELLFVKYFHRHTPKNDFLPFIDRKELAGELRDAAARLYKNAGKIIREHLAGDESSQEMLWFCNEKFRRLNDYKG